MACISESEVLRRANLSPSLSQMSPEKQSLWLIDAPAQQALETCHIVGAPKAEGRLGQITQAQGQQDWVLGEGLEGWAGKQATERGHIKGLLRHYWAICQCFRLPAASLCWGFLLLRPQEILLVFPPPLQPGCPYGHCLA